MPILVLLKIYIHRRKTNLTEGESENEETCCSESAVEGRRVVILNAVMNTKTNHGYASNPYNEGIMENKSPAALLDMLAEVASQTLHSEKKLTSSILTLQYKSKADTTKRRTQELLFNVPQLLSMPASQLVKQFTIFTSDELKRQYSYTCALIAGCGQKYTSFASEGKARISIKAHLAEHLEYLKANTEVYNTFIAKSINSKTGQVNVHNKKSKLQNSKKPQEALNKENKNIIQKSTSYLKNILMKDSFKELTKQKEAGKKSNVKKLQSSEYEEADKTVYKVLGDHSYFERLKEDMPDTKEMSSNSSLQNTEENENIVLMVVGTDSVHMKEYSHINHEQSQMETEGEIEYFSDTKWPDKGQNNNIESTITKPKGKAKFIGTSKEEREMALAFMDRIKKKGNPTGSNLECRICKPPRSFTAPTTLVSHYRSHAGIKPYECRICRAVFTRRHSLKYHMLIHQNQTRFTCADCGKKFRHPSHFREHRRRHTGEAPFGCDDCGQRFKTRNTYKRHLKTRHGKVLTTTGELLFLSEEDFQKVKTNRKRKIDFDKEPMINEDVIASKAIAQYEDDNDESPITMFDGDDYTTTGEISTYESTEDFAKEGFQAYEILEDSRVDKTESIETEVCLDNVELDSKRIDPIVQYVKRMEDDIQQMEHTSCDALELGTETEESTTILQDNIQEHPEIIFENIDDVGYIKVEHNGDISNIERSNMIEYKNNIDLFEGDIVSHVEVIDSGTFNNETIIDETDQENVCSQVLNETLLEEEQYSNSNDIVEGTELEINLNHAVSDTEAAISTHMNNISEEGESYKSDCIFLPKRKNVLSNGEGANGSIENNIDTSPINTIEIEQYSALSNPHIYINTDSITGVIIQKKTNSVTTEQLKSLYEQRESLTSLNNVSDELAQLNKSVEAYNVKNLREDNAILFLTDDILKSNIFRVGQSITAKKDKKVSTNQASK